MTGPIHYAVSALALALVIGCGNARKGDSDTVELTADEARRAASTEDMVEQAVVAETTSEGDDTVASIPAASTSDPERNPIHKSRQNQVRKQLKAHGKVFGAIRKLAKAECADLIPTGNRTKETRKALLSCVQEKATEGGKTKLAEVIGNIITKVDEGILDEQGHPTLENAKVGN